MKQVMKNNPLFLLGSLAGTCLIASVVFANPSMLPDHPGHPMKPLKSPVTGQSLANDPGQNPLVGQNALNAAVEEGNEDMKLRTEGSLEEKRRMKEKTRDMKKSQR
jgi:hypothetical protein